MINKIWELLESVDNDNLTSNELEELKKIKEIREIINNDKKRTTDEFRTWRIRYGEGIKNIAEKVEESKKEYYDFGAYSSDVYHKMGLNNWLLKNDKHIKLINMRHDKDRIVFHPYILGTIEFIKTTDTPDLITKRKNSSYIIHEEFKIRTDYENFDIKKEFKSWQIERFNNIDRHVLGYVYYIENNGYRACDKNAFRTLESKQEYKLTMTKKMIDSGSVSIKTHADSLANYYKNPHLENENPEDIKAHFVINLTITEIVVFDNETMTYSHIASNERNLWRLAVEHENALCYAFDKGVDAITYITRRKDVTDENTIDEVMFNKDVIAITITKDEFTNGIIDEISSELEFLELKSFYIDFNNFYQVEVMKSAQDLIEKDIISPSSDYIQIRKILDRIDELDRINPKISTTIRHGAMNTLNEALNYESYISFFEDSSIKRKLYIGEHQGSIIVSQGISRYLNEPGIERKNSMRCYTIQKKVAVEIFPEVVKNYNEIEFKLQEVLGHKMDDYLLSDNYYIFTDYNGELFVKDENLIGLLNDGKTLKDLLSEFDNDCSWGESKLINDLIEMEDKGYIVTAHAIGAIIDQLLLIGFKTIDSAGSFVLSNSKGCGSKVEITKISNRFNIDIKDKVEIHNHTKGFNGFVKVYVMPEFLVESFVKLSL